MIANLKEYLEQVVKLESSIYSQERICNEAQKNLKPHTPRKPHVIEPQKPVLAIQKPNICCPVDGVDNVDTEITKGYRNSAIVFGIIGVFATVLAVALSVALSNYDAEGMWFLYVMAIGTLAISVIFFNMWRKSREDTKYNYEQSCAQYAEAMKQYEKEKIVAEQTYDAELKAYELAMQQYAQDVQSADVKYQNEIVIAKNNYDKGVDAVGSLVECLQQTRNALQKLYDVNVVFPKYRNLVAMCTIYEYVASGRCSTLEGADGAYNLYEAELRQNLIINQLDMINQNLEAIKMNQYMLYQEMTKANITLDKISHDITRIKTATQEIKRLTGITAHCSAITAQNTEAIKYLSLIN